MKNNLPTIALIGRPNVGKSTLFNRLAGKKLAIVDDTPGITRDWRTAEGRLFDKKINIIDTAGLEERFDDSIEGKMRQKTNQALQNADIAVFMIDGRTGITPMDEHFAGWLLKTWQKPLILVINKSENENAVRHTIAESWSLGLGEPVALSSAHGNGMEELYSALQPFLETHKNNKNEENKENTNTDNDKSIKIAIVGRPNVGKSTLLNALLKENRVMTNDEAGTTRDAIAIDWEYKGKKIRLVDTAGLRKKPKINEKIEKMSVEDTLRAIRLAQIVILVIDANNMFEKQDLQIASHIIEEGRALVVAINKWDTIRDKKTALEEIKENLEFSISQIKDIPYTTISALNGKNTNKLMETVLNTYSKWGVRISTGELNRWLSMAESRHPAPLVSGRQNRLKYISQINTRPPTFSLWVSRPKKLPKTYRKYIINELQKSFGISNVPVRLLVRSGKNPYNNKK